MIIFWVMLKVLIFGLCLGAAISVLIFVPLTVYAIPYCLWVGFQNNVGKQLDKKNEGLRSIVRNATKLYRAKLSGQEPIF